MAACSEHDFWYHSYYFDNGYTIRGDYDIGRDVLGYGFPLDMHEMTVLDVGVGSGWFSFWFEQCGATVTATDVRGYTDFDVFGRPEHPPIEIEKPEPDTHERGRPIYFSPVSRGFWIMRDLLHSQVRYVNVRISDLTPNLFDGQRFDLVFVGALLLHVRDPVGALAAVRSVCRGSVIATTPLAPSEYDAPMPTMILPWTDVDNISWWQPNLACYRKWFEAAGFQDVDVSRTVRLTSDLARKQESNPAGVNNPTHILTIAQAKI